MPFSAKNMQCGYNIKILYENQNCQIKVDNPWWLLSEIGEL